MPASSSLANIWGRVDCPSSRPPLDPGDFKEGATGLIVGAQVFNKLQRYIIGMVESSYRQLSAEPTTEIIVEALTLLSDENIDIDVVKATLQFNQSFTQDIDISERGNIMNILNHSHIPAPLLTHFQNTQSKTTCCVAFEHNKLAIRTILAIATHCKWPEPGVLLPIEKVSNAAMWRMLYDGTFLADCGIWVKLVLWLLCHLDGAQPDFEYGPILPEHRPQTQCAVLIMSFPRGLQLCFPREWPSLVEDLAQYVIQIDNLTIGFTAKGPIVLEETEPDNIAAFWRHFALANMFSGILNLWANKNPVLIGPGNIWVFNPETIRAMVVMTMWLLPTFVLRLSE